MYDDVDALMPPGLETAALMPGEFLGGMDEAADHGDWADVDALLHGDAVLGAVDSVRVPALGADASSLHMHGREAATAPPLLPAAYDWESRLQAPGSRASLVSMDAHPSVMRWPDRRREALLQRTHSASAILGVNGFSPPLFDAAAYLAPISTRAGAVDEPTEGRRAGSVPVSLTTDRAGSDTPAARSGACSTGRSNSPVTPERSQSSSGDRALTLDKAAALLTSDKLVGERARLREEAVWRYREKKKRRCFEKTIRYDCRKRLAINRPRVRGRFVKRQD